MASCEWYTHQYMHKKCHTLLSANPTEKAKGRIKKKTTHSHTEQRQSRAHNAY